MECCCFGMFVMEQFPTEEWQNSKQHVLFIQLFGCKRSIVLDSGTMYFEGHPAVRALCHHSTTGALITGTIGCDIVSISEAEKVGCFYSTL